MDEEAKLLIELQDFFQEGVVIVVGSGLSARYGLPGMPHLADHLQATVPSSLAAADEVAWNDIVRELKAGRGLEAALQSKAVSEGLLQILVRESAACIEEKERDLLRSIATGLAISPISHLIGHILKSSRDIHIVTPNYDRLIECQLERANIPINTSYVGSYLAWYDSERSAIAQKEYILDGKRIRTVHHRHVCIHKPHGSLDWYVQNNQVIRSFERLELPRAIITPGLAKYRVGYSLYYDQQRSAAARALEKAQRVLVIGYGFNDDQLEHSWCPGLTTSKRLVILTKNLTPNALTLLSSSGTAIALCEDPNNPLNALVYRGCATPKSFSKRLWDLDIFVREVIR